MNLGSRKALHNKSIALRHYTTAANNCFREDGCMVVCFLHYSTNVVGFKNGCQIYFFIFSSYTFVPCCFSCFRNWSCLLLCSSGLFLSLMKWFD